MNCETHPIHNTNCLNWWDERGCLSTAGNVILYFMGDFRRARLWTGAMKLAYLAPRLKELDTAVVLVGEVAESDDRRLGAAARLAEALDLPFPLLADGQHTLWRRYASAPPEPARTRAGLILVDSRGRPAGCWPLQTRKQTLDLPALLEAVEALSACRS